MNVAGVPHRAASAEPAFPGRIVPLVAAAICVIGSLLFLGGGRLHPGIGAGLGATPGEFFLAFAEKVRHTPGWQGMHMMILLGPLCWAVAAPALVDSIHPEARGITSTARSALLLSGALWAVAFVLDGFGAPVYAEALASSGGGEERAGILTSFAATAVMMSRLGLVSWVFGGFGMMVLGGLLLSPGVRTRWRTAVAAIGIILGGWPLLAALGGEYSAGPFTSSFWMPNALAVGLWYMALATCALGTPSARGAELAPGPISEDRRQSA